MLHGGAIGRNDVFIWQILAFIDNTGQESILLKRLNATKELLSKSIYWKTSHQKISINELKALHNFFLNNYKQQKVYKTMAKPLEIILKDRSLRRETSWDGVWKKSIVSNQNNQNNQNQIYTLWDHNCKQIQTFLFMWACMCIWETKSKSLEALHKETLSHMEQLISHFPITSKGKSTDRNKLRKK